MTVKKQSCFSFTKIIYDELSIVKMHVQKVWVHNVKIEATSKWGPSEPFCFISS